MVLSHAAQLHLPDRLYIEYASAACCDNLDPQKVIWAHRLAMSAENILGVFLEEYLFEKPSSHGWSMAWGETIKHVDLCSSSPAEIRYDFKYTKISTGLFGVNRVFLPSSNIFPTLVASDSNDYVTDIAIKATDIDTYRRRFIEEVFMTGRYRRVTKSEACRIQGFPFDFILPESRARWMKLIGNSVSVPVLEQLIAQIASTGVFKTPMS